MRILGTIIISFLLCISTLQAESPENIRENIDSFITKYQHSMGVLTRVIFQVKEVEKQYTDLSRETLDLLIYFYSGLENQISKLREKNIAQNKKDTKVREIKALYYSAYAASRKSKIDEIIDIAKGTEINALVIDIKEIDGKTSFAFNSEDFSDIKPKSNNRISDISSTLTRLKDNNIYTIGRIVVFKDSYLANARPDLAIKWSWDTNKIWSDYKGNNYTDPASKSVWEYHIELASAAYKLGFDEINFDYVRYPSDGYISQSYYPKSKDTLSANPKWGKMIVMDRFSEYINRKLKELHPNIVVSADVFGLVTNTNMFQIGQNIESFVLYFDYVAPMIYPSHYAAGYLGYSVPDNAPYEIFYDAMKTAKSKVNTLNDNITRAQSGTGKLLIQGVFETSAPKMSLKKVDTNKIRPWLQGFSCSWCPGATDYTATKFRRQIQAIQDLGFTSGWYVWNSSARYVQGWYK